MAMLHATAMAGAEMPTDASADPAVPAATASVARQSGARIDAIDLARGLAVCLMILSHGINGMLAFEQFSDAGMLLHAVTKFASSLFILVFGIALAVAFVPKTHTPDWPRLRLKLLLGGVVVLFWYKLLTVVEMAGTFPREAIVDALLYRGFPSYVEILGFYAIALLWIPFVLPLWARAPLALKLAVPAAMLLASWWLLQASVFAERPTLQALLVEHPDHYTWGQLSRGWLVFAGLLLGGVLLQVHADPSRRRRFALALLGASAVFFVAFLVLVGGGTAAELDAIARNAGKHPPELNFMLFSLGGAVGLLGLAVLGGNTLARVLAPVALIGRHALQAFVFHIVVVFVLFRYLLGYVDNTTYPHALALTLGLLAATAAWIALTAWVRRRRRA